MEGFFTDGSGNFFPWCCPRERDRSPPGRELDRQQRSVSAPIAPNAGGSSPLGSSPTGRDPAPMLAAREASLGNIPRSSDAKLLLEGVRLCLRCRDFNNAQSILLRGLETYPNNPQLLMTFALYLIEVEKKQDVAMSYMEEVLRQCPGSADGLALMAWLKFSLSKDVDVARSMIRTISQQQPPTTCASLWRLGELCWLVDHDITTASKFFHMALALDKDDARALGFYGVMLSSDLSRDYSTAEKYFKASLTVDAYNEEIEHEYGVLLHKSGRHDDAELHFRKAVELSPHHGDYLYNLAVLLHVVQHKFSEAIEVYKRAIGVGSGSNLVNAMSNCAMLLEEYMHDYNKAEELYKQALVINPTHVQTLSSYARLLQNVRKDYDAAEQYYRQALAIDSNDSVTLHNFAVILHTVRKDYKQAQNLYCSALEANPNNALAASHYAILLHTCLGDLVHAEKYYKQAINADRSNPLHYANYTNFMQFKDKQLLNGAALQPRHVANSTAPMSIPPRNKPAANGTAANGHSADTMEVDPDIKASPINGASNSVPKTGSAKMLPLSNGRLPSSGLSANTPAPWLTGHENDKETPDLERIFDEMPASIPWQ